MPGRAFIGFDQDNTGSAYGFPSAGIGHRTNAAATSCWGWWAKPPYVFHNRGVATQDQTMAPPNHRSSGTTSIFGDSLHGVGCSLGMVASASDYGAATATTRATYVTAQGFQIAVVRSMVNPSLLSDDHYWFTFDLNVTGLGTSSLSTSYTPPNAWQAIFRWGDVSIYCKETIYIGNSKHDIVFSIRNNGSEVRTLTVPGVVATGVAMTTAHTMFCVLHVKLHSTDGLIDFYVNGNQQSSAYDSQNTVNTISNAAATEIYFSPTTFDNGTIAYVGSIDNIFIETDTPTGRPTPVLWNPVSDGALSNAEAYGTSPSTVVDALSSTNTAKALRLTANNGRANINHTAPVTTGLGEMLLAELHVIGAANRNPYLSQKVTAGVSLSGTDGIELSYGASKALPFSSKTLPPEVSATITHVFEQIFEKNGGGRYSLANVATLTSYIRVY